MIEFVTHGPKLVEVRKDGTFAGWLAKETRRTSGLHSRRVTWWEGRIAGTAFEADTLTLAKARILAAFPDTAPAPSEPDAL